MMKSATILLFIAAGIILLSADSANPLKGKLKTVYMDHWHDTLTYHYDNEGRITSLTTNKGYITTYEYKGNMIVADTKGGSRVTMYLNSRGLVDSLTDIDTNRRTTYGQFGTAEMVSFGIRRYFPYSGNHVLPLDEIAAVTTHGVIGILKRFTYDENGFIKNQAVYNQTGNPLLGKPLGWSTGPVVRLVNNMEKGNISAYTVTYPVDTITMINAVTLKEETRIVNQSDFTVQNSFDTKHLNSLVDSRLFGKSNRNLIRRSVSYVKNPAGQPVDSNVTNFLYTFDRQKRVSSLITKVQTNDPPEVKVNSERPDTCYFTYY